MSPIERAQQVIADYRADEFVCANCKGAFDDLEAGRDPEELCPSCWNGAQESLRAARLQEGLEK